jgi:hypothetical protein
MKGRGGVDCKSFCVSFERYIWRLCEVRGMDGDSTFQPHDSAGCRAKFKALSFGRLSLIVNSSNCTLFTPAYRKGQDRG